MKKFIELTMMQGIKVYVNIDHIGSLYRSKETSYQRGVNDVDITIVGVTTHNNGGFRVIETVEEILNLINN